MEIDAPDSKSAADDIVANWSPAAASEDAHTPQSSPADVLLTDPLGDVGCADDSPTPSGSTAAVGDESATDKQVNFRTITEIIKSCTAPCLAANEWQFLDKGSWLRIDMPALEFVEAMQQEFVAEGLIFLGLCERAGEELQPSSWLDGDAPLYVEIDVDNRKIAFSHDSGYLFPMERNALDYALERNPLESAQEPATLFVVESQDDVEIMQRLGLRAVRCEGLESLGSHDIQRLFDGDDRSDHGWRFFLVLVDFDVVRLKNHPMATIGAVIKRLADAVDVYGKNPARRFGVCRPSAPEFQVLGHATNFKDSVQICQLFEKWAAAAKSERINSWRTHFATAVPTLSAARASLARALQHSNDVARRAAVLDALRAYRAAGKDAVIQNFYKAIDHATDPFDQVDLIAAAGFAETFLDCDPLVRAGEAVLAGKTPPPVLQLQVELFEQRQQYLVELRRIRRDRKAKR